MTEPDFAWVTEKLLETADKHCGGKLVSTLEGGYDLDALRQLDRRPCANLDVSRLLILAAPVRLSQAAMAKDTDQSDIKTMSFEQALKELETIVDRLEKGDVELEASILIYERGEALKTHCEACCARPRPRSRRSR